MEELSIYIPPTCVSDQTCVELHTKHGELNWVQKLVIYMNMMYASLGMLLKLARFLSRDNVWDRFEGVLYFIQFMLMAAWLRAADLNKKVHVLLWVMTLVCSIAMLLLARRISNDNRRIQNQNPNLWRRRG